MGCLFFISTYCFEDLKIQPEFGERRGGNMGFFQWAILGIGIAVIILLYMIAEYVKQSLSYLDLIRESTASCYSILRNFADDRAREHLQKQGLLGK